MHHSIKMAYTLPGNDAKMLRYKRYLFNTYLSHINYQSGSDYLFQDCTLSEAAIQSKSNVVWDVVQCTKVNKCLEEKYDYSNIKSNALEIYLFTQQPSIEDTVAITHSSRNWCNWNQTRTRQSIWKRGINNQCSLQLTVLM